MKQVSVFNVSHLSVVFGKNRQRQMAVNDVSFQIPRGKTIGLVGESGSGKSTIARAISKIGPITSGRVNYEGKSIEQFNSADKRKFRRNVQMIFQDPFESLNPRLKVGEIIAEGIDNFHLAKNKHDRFHQVEALLISVGLPVDAIDRYPHEFSGGQRQRIGIARALAIQPKFLILDEPVSALDVSIQAQIINLLKDIQKQRNLTYLFIAHDLSIVRYISDSILVMYKGRIVETGPAEEVYQHPLHQYTRSLLSAAPQADLYYERRKKFVTYDRDQFNLTGKLVEVEPDHWVLQAPAK
ncbi:ATP-binding cassette domain-containing protein [Lentilactobacillus diolivorans]|uniref:ABC transporter ATP-binding protein n=1 Tax=Lentilactobacillus diolivorans TaxID=179838 RepID=A0ABQ0XFC5_9LACO|nr:ATP-binding cassette domain-containing protein [Lentilactobacillus diolivorans]GEP24776.1 ABC transporter ATP-binding protein [Lentilactobacillus diolivorans]